jgi:hypothetical protein
MLDLKSSCLRDRLGVIHFALHADFPLIPQALANSAFFTVVNRWS